MLTRCIKYFLLLVSITFSASIFADEPIIIELDETFTILHPEKVQVGDTYSALLNGKPYKSTLTAIDKSGLTWIDSEGCITKRLVQFSFPSLWKNCKPFQDDAVTVEYGGKVWPLEKDRKFYFKIDSGDQSLVRTCKAGSSYKVETIRGEYDTLEIKCEDLWNTLVWYLDIDSGETIIHVHENSYYKFKDIYITVD